MKKRFCLCCGKPIEEGLWHKECLKDFFGSETLPDLHLDRKQMETIALSQLSEKKTVAGVQEKLSLHLDFSAQGRPRLTIIGFPTGYILKPQSSSYKRLPEFEQTAMLLANCCNIITVKHGLIPVGENELAYITKRIDRDGNKKIHMEDFAQASGTLTADKYRSSYEACADLITRYSQKPIADKARFFECVYFCFLIGNSDAHLKNFSFLMDEKGHLSLAPFYDLLPTKVILPADYEDLALLLHNKKTNLTKGDFDAFASEIGINDLAKKKIMKRIEDHYDEMCRIIDESPLDQNSKTVWKKLIQTNIRRANRP